MMPKKIALFLICFSFFFSQISLKSHVARAEPQKMTTAWLAGHEAFAVWYAQKHNWDTELNLDIDMLKFNSGREIVDSMRAYNWQIAGIGAFPAVFSILSDDIEIIAVANDESSSNVIYAPKDSPLLQTQGYNPVFPDIYGSPQLVEGKKIFTTKSSSAHYLLISWLRALGVMEEDVKIQFLEQKAITGTMKNNLATAYSLWAPHTYKAEELGFMPIANSRQVEIFQPILLVANAQFAKENPEKIQSFLKLYMKGIDMIKQAPQDVLLKEYQTFHKEFIGMNITTEDATRDLKNHLVFSLDEQLEFFRKGTTPSKLQKTLIDIIDFYTITNAINDEERTRLLELVDLNSSYLNAIKE